MSGQAKHQPVTPLPWTAGGSSQCGYGWLKESPSGRIPLDGQYRGQEVDAAYIAHAANAYPRLLKMVQDLRKAVESDGGSGCAPDVDQLLRELGEE